MPESELVARALGLAEDMLSCLPDALVQYKALIDDGYATNFGESLELETIRTSATNRQVQGASVEERRRAILARGRQKTDD